MATKVKKTVRRETTGGIFEKGKVRPVIISLEPPNVIGFRLKGMHRSYFLTAEGCYMQALRVAIAAEKREKQKRRKNRS